MPGAQQLWSTSPGTNQTADPQINLREGMSPSQVNDAARQMMAKLKAYLLDTSGVLVTGGTSTAYTLTTNEVFTALVDGTHLSFRVHATNGSPATLNVDGLGAVPLRVEGIVEIPAGYLQIGVELDVTYVEAVPEWRAKAPGRGYLDAPAGTRMSFNQAAAPTGWVKEVGAAYDNAALRFVTGTGGGTGGTAGFTTAFAARTIAQANLPNVNLAADSAGSHAHGGLTTTETASHTHSPGAGSNFIVSGVGFEVGNQGATGVLIGQAPITNVENALHSHGISSDGAHTHSVPLGGSGTALDFAVKRVDFIIAEKA